MCLWCIVVLIKKKTTTKCTTLMIRRHFFYVAFAIKWMNLMLSIIFHGGANELANPKLMIYSWRNTSLNEAELICQLRVIMTY